MPALDDLPDRERVEILNRALELNERFHKPPGEVEGILTDEQRRHVEDLLVEVEFMRIRLRDLLPENRIIETEQEHDE